MIIRILCLLMALVLVGCDRQGAEWEEAQEKDTITAYEAFAESYPESPEADQARSRIETLRAEQAWSDARQRDTVEAYRGFIEAHPDAATVDVARSRLQTLEREAAWQDLADSENAGALRAFAANYAGSPEAELARERRPRLKQKGASANRRPNRNAKPSANARPGAKPSRPRTTCNWRRCAAGTRPTGASRCSSSASTNCWVTWALKYSRATACICW